ncbi:MAG: GerMN domain-containing protein [Gemmatimonadota bacterium]
MLSAVGCGTAVAPGGPATTPPAQATTTVKVYFHQGTGDGRLAAVTRAVPRTSAVATAALSQLLAGPTAAERSAGYWSWFSGKTAGMLNSVRIANGVGYADFRDFRAVIPNASSSAGSAALLAQLDHTFMQFPSVTKTVYSFNGDVAAFYEWLQLTPPAPGLTTSVKVFFHKNIDSPPVAVTRTVPRTSAVATAALSQLLAGPTAAERSAGYSSWFSGKTAGMLKSVRIADGVGYADFRDFRLIISGASSSAGSGMLLGQLDHTFMQFPNVTETVYSFNGNVGDFYYWLQRTPPNLTPPGTARAVDAARSFLLGAGMRGLITGTVQWAGTGVVDAQFRSDIGSGPVTTVTVQRQADGTWLPLAARTPLIEVAQPTRQQAITSPVTVAGRSGTFEGQLLASIQQFTAGTVTELGRNNSIIGGSTGMAPFSGQVSFRQPAASGTTWLIVTYQSAKTGALAGVTAVQVTTAR